MTVMRTVFSCGRVTHVGCHQLFTVVQAGNLSFTLRHEVILVDVIGEQQFFCVLLEGSGTGTQRQSSLDKAAAESAALWQATRVSTSPRVVPN